MKFEPTQKLEKHKPENLTPPSEAGGSGSGDSVAFLPWYRLHTGTPLQKTAEISHLRQGHFRAKIYPSGFILEGHKMPCLPPPVDVQRGEITDFSAKAARRLREAFFTLYAPESCLWAVTLTTHAIFSPNEWRATMMRFRQAVKRRSWAGIWRVELQKRKAPHAHVAFWLPTGCSIDRVRDLWLTATGESHDPEAIKHAVHGREIPQDESGWAIYLGLHSGKHKESQLGWLGKQWGIWNQAALVERVPVELALKPREHALLLRILRNLEIAEKMRFETKKSLRDYHALSYNFPEWAGSLAVRVKRPRRKLLHRGNLLRCTSGDRIEFLIREIQSGRIGRTYPLAA